MEQNQLIDVDPEDGWLFRVWVHLALLFGVTAFLAMLFAPLFSEIFEKPLIRKYLIYPNCEELVRKSMKPIKRTLWGLCVIAWIVIITLNA